ncbi:MAG: PleD family two-component system response regulator [Ahrensia sp.]
MTARILVVDDIQANIDLLKSRLEAEYFEVLTADSGKKALDVLDTEVVDIVLLDIMMPEMDGFEVCSRMKANPAVSHIPVVMVTALDQAEDRNKGLAVGADDFLTKPVNETQLFARVKSLVRLKLLTDELRLRAVTTRDIAVRDLLDPAKADSADKPRVLLVDERRSAFERISGILRAHAVVEHVTEPQTGLLRAAEEQFDCVFVAADFSNFDPLRLCSQLRSLERTRFLPIIMVCDEQGDKFISRALELGVNDYLVRPLDPNEVIARLKTQVRRKRYHEGLRTNVAESVEMSVTDGLTGLNNRRYLDQHLSTLVERAKSRGRELSIMITDIDRFKLVNDTYGHAVGDDVLREFSKRLRANIRGIDLACRYGGEEFVVVMPDTSAIVAAEVAERLRESIDAMQFTVAAGKQQIAVTASVGVASLVDRKTDSGETLMEKADKALYEAKNNGRNRVVSKAA